MGIHDLAGEYEKNPTNEMPISLGRKVNVGIDLHSILGGNEFNRNVDQMYGFSHIARSTKCCATGTCD